VKCNKRRWYVLCHVPGKEADDNIPEHFRKFGRLTVYALDRIINLDVTDKHFTFPDDFDPEVFFANYFGVCIGYDVPLQRILVKMDASQRSYLKTLPLHSSQCEVETHEDYSIYEYKLYPTIDFLRALLSFGGDAEVIAPQELRDIMANEVEYMNGLYNGEC